jgi:hypothetical protein
MAGLVDWEVDVVDEAEVAGSDEIVDPIHGQDDGEDQPAA